MQGISTEGVLLALLSHLLCIFSPVQMGDDVVLADGGACELPFTPLMSNVW